MTIDPDSPWMDAQAPVETVDTGSVHKKPQAGIALCLSGGGYRAMLFHLGALWRLNDAGYLPRLDRISSVSGGSITAAALGLKWSELEFDDKGMAKQFPKVVDLVRHLSSHTIDRLAAVLGALPWVTGGCILPHYYRRHVFRDATLQDLPDRPRFVLNATNVQSGVLWRFMKPYMRDYRVGEIKTPALPLCVAVAASSAFPPFLSPVVLKPRESDFTPRTGKDLQRPPFTTKVVLTDGGVYDNLGMETAWKRYETILVSNAGVPFDPLPRPRYNWISQTQRVLYLIDGQVRALRKRQLLDAFVRYRRLAAAAEELQQAVDANIARKGAYWSIRTDIDSYGLPDSLPCSPAVTQGLASIPTRLKRLSNPVQEQLINWGYAICDVALRRYVDSTLTAPRQFPYPIGVGQAAGGCS